MDRSIIVIAHNIRSAHNVGSLLRTCDGLGIEKIFLTGYTPYPQLSNDERLPHLAQKINNRIAKTALGAEKTVSWDYQEDVLKVIKDLNKNGYSITGLEQTEHSQPLHKFKAPSKVALVLGEEVTGIDPKIIEKCDHLVEIPMLGSKESLNVTIAAAITLYHLRFRQ